MWPSITTGNESSSASADQSCWVLMERQRAGLERGIVGGKGWHERWRDEMREEMKQLHMKYKHSVRNIQHSIVPDSLAASSSLRASHCCFSNEEWKCFNIKASGFRPAVSAAGNSETSFISADIYILHKLFVSAFTVWNAPLCLFVARFRCKICSLI